MNDTLIKLGKEQFLVELQKGRLGEKLLREVSTNERFRVPQLLAWTYFTENALKLIKNYSVPKDIVAKISTKKVWYSRTVSYKYTIACIDLGLKRSLIKDLKD